MLITKVSEINASSIIAGLNISDAVSNEVVDFMLR